MYSKDLLQYELTMNTELTTTVEQYKNREISLQRAAAEESVSIQKMRQKLRSQGVELREEDIGFITSTRY